MKVKDLQESRLAPTNQNDVIAKWLAKGLRDGRNAGPHKLFINTALNIEPEGGLNNAVKAIQEWNVVARFIHEHSDQTPIMIVSPRELNKWIEEFKDNQ